ncbi:hypothetical protein MAL01_19210 (plasmid) [Leptospira noguchii]|uniref:hypothetical protein n=1 Tax=Leptospira noguchii TaxID=28182 RepID=UPI001FB621FC|nr:hypothetical protein [Leptospira noguchii]UOG36199.1 hypothetical protein MAL02_18810 [Leptospira noguchii]UOG47162.1 hypothetical protein MAL01_19210 [Leptospira noguchii]
MYSIEIGENEKSSECYCCGRESSVGHGFVYKNAIAYAVYYIGWSNAHEQRKITFALAIGKWDDTSTAKDRQCFGFEAYEKDEKIAFRIIDPSESPWPHTELLGEMLSRTESLVNPLLKEVFSIAEEIIQNHPAVRQYLNL